MFARLALSVACLVSASCGGELLRTGRSPLFMIVQGLEGEGGAVLLSDVGSTGNDTVSATISTESKNPTAPTTGLNAVSVNRYRVRFLRSDGRNTPGVDVPYGFDGAVAVTIAPGGTGTVTFDLVRHQAKLEPPLRNLVAPAQGSGSTPPVLGGLGFISAIAEVTFFGHDQNGNELTATGSMDVQFGDFPNQ